MSDELDLDEITKLADAATPEPWHVTSLPGMWLTDDGYEKGMTYHVFEAEQRGDGECGSMLPGDAEFVAASRTLVPALVAALRAEREAVENIIIDLVEDAFHQTSRETGCRRCGVHKTDFGAARRTDFVLWDHGCLIGKASIETRQRAMETAEARTYAFHQGGTVEEARIALRALATQAAQASAT